MWLHFRPSRKKTMRNKTCVWIPWPAPENTHGINAEELSVSWLFLLVLVSKGFLQSEGRNPALQTLVRESGRKIDHLFQEENKHYEITIKKSAAILSSYGHIAFLIHLRGRGFLRNAMEKNPMVFPVATVDMLSIWNYRQVEQGPAGNLRISLEKLAANTPFFLFSNDSNIFFTCMPNVIFFFFCLLVFFLLNALQLAQLSTGLS